MSNLIVLAAFLAAAAVFWTLTGSKIKLRARSVRFGDEVIETRKATGKSTQDRLIMIAGGLVLGALALAVTGTWYFAAAGLFGGVFVLKWWKQKQEDDWMELLKSQFIDVLGQLDSAMYGGLNPYQAIEDAVPNMPRPARDVFYEVLRRTRTGDTLAQALESVRKETGWEELKVLSIGMSLYNRVGCNLGEICRHAMETYEDRESFRSIITAAIAQNMMTARILTAVPFIFVGAARVMAPGFADPLFNTIEGTFVFSFATVWIIAGNIFIRKMIKNTLGQGV